MTPEQALIFLKQVLVLKSGLSVDDCAGVVAAWNALAEMVQKANIPVPAPVPEPAKEEGKKGGG